MSSSLNPSLVPDQTGSLQVEEWSIHYDRYGTGSQIILMIPGAIGTAKSDFHRQLSGPFAFDRSKYTMIVVELAGWGRSRPPRRPYGPGLFERDAVCVTKVMEHLNYRTYSIIGWSDGAKVALLAAIINPNPIQSVVAMGPMLYCHRTSLCAALKTQNVNLWDPEMLRNYREVYGEELQPLWDNHINYTKDFHTKVVNYAESRPDLKEVRFAVYDCDPLMNGLSKIRCPVLVLHGDKDPLIGIEQTEFCRTRMANCVLRRFPDASHNLHQTNAEQFHKVVNQFLDDSCGDFF